MRNRQDIVLKAFLVDLPPEKREALVRHLSEDRRNNLSNLPDISLEKENDNPSAFDQIHWSWFSPAIQNYAKEEQKLFLRSLHVLIQKPLSQMLEISPTSENLSPLGAAYLRKTLLNQVEKKEILPYHLLPSSPLNQLLYIEKKKLIRLIDFLSLYDLSCEIKQIVETKTLNKIYSCLTEEERKFLKVASHYKEPYPPVKIHLETWDGTKQALRHMLHKIGLARLGSALANEDPDLTWHVCHLLDRGRGKALMKLTKTTALPGVAKWLAEQLRECL